MKGEVQAKRVLLAKRLFFAESSMHQARSLAQYAFDNQVGKLQDVFRAPHGGMTPSVRHIITEALRVP